MIQKLKLILSLKTASLLIILFAIAGRIIQVIYFSSLAGDRAFQILAAKNFAAGHGITTTEVFANNLTTIHYIPLIKWPAGYSFLLSFFYNICGEHFFYGALLLDIVAAALLVWIARKIMLLFHLPLHLINLYTIVTGFFLYEFCAVCSTDLIAAVLYEAAIYFTLLFILSDKKKYSTAFLISFLLFAGGSIRYLSLPIAFAVPVYFICFGFFYRKKIFISRGFFIFSMVTFLTVVMLLVQHLYAGSATYMYPVKKGFYPENILRTDTFIFSSFINPGILYMQLEKLSGLSYKTLITANRLLHLAMIAGLLFPFFYWIRGKKNTTFSIKDHFIFIGIFSSLIIIALLWGLTLTNAPIPLSPLENWVYAEEGRYYFILFLFIQQWVFIAFAYYKPVNKRMYNFLFAIMFLLFASVIHDVYFTIKIAGKNRQKDNSDIVKYHRILLEEVQKENPGKFLIASAADEVNSTYDGIWLNIPSLRDYNKLNTSDLATTKEALIFVTLQKKDLDFFKPFINNVQTKLAGQTGDLYFYTINVKPK